MTSTAPTPAAEPRWVLVVPVKRLPAAKTRLAPLAGPRRPALALALACDTVHAALACPAVAGVVVVTSDAQAHSALEALGALVVPDEPDAGLNPALRFGASVAQATFAGTHVGALSADLAALRPAELATVLAAARQWPSSFVADVAGTGTTAVFARAGTALTPEFGPRSRARHRAAGLHELMLSGVVSVRRDIDTEVDLWDAERLGVGPRTAALLATLRSP